LDFKQPPERAAPYFDVRCEIFLAGICRRTCSTIWFLFGVQLMCADATAKKKSFASLSTKRKIRHLGKILIAVGVLMIFFLLFTNVYTRYQQQKLARSWDEKQNSAAKSSSLAPKTSETAPPDSDFQYYKELKEKSAFAKLVIPKIDLDMIVVEGTSEEALKQGPGHMKGTAFPGEIGNTVISGHRVTYLAPFNRLDELKVGDLIVIYSPSEKFKYSVIEKKVVSPKDTSVIQPTSDPILTLTTCHPPYSAKQRLIIKARLLSSPRLQFSEH
jgi:sortase A